MSPSLAPPPHDTGRRRDALSIDALVDSASAHGSRPRASTSAELIPPQTRQCGKCQEAHSKCDGREPCRNCEVRGTLCGYAWSSFGSPHTLLPPVVEQRSPPPGPRPAARSPQTPYFPAPKRPASHNGHRSPESSIFPRSAPLDGGWALVPSGANVPAATTRGGEPGGPPITSCKTCQARNTPCDGVTPVCGSCRMRRLECYLATPKDTSSADRKNILTWSARDKQALNPRSFPPSLMHPSMMFPPHPGSGPVPGPSRPRAVSAKASSRSSLSFMLNPSGGEDKTKTSPPAKSHKPAELKPVNTHPSTPTHHVTPPTPVAPSSMEQAQATGPSSSRMDVDEPQHRLGSPLQHRDRASSPGPLSPTSSTGATLSRRPSRKRSASPDDHEPRRYDDSRDWAMPGRESASPSRDSVSSMGVSGIHLDAEGRQTRLRSSGSISHVEGGRTHSQRLSIDSHTGRTSLDSHSGRPVDSHSHSTRPSVDRLSIDSHAPHARDSLDPTPTYSRPRSRSKSSLSHLLDGGGYGGMGRNEHTPTAETQASPTDTTASEAFSRPLSAESLSRPMSRGSFSRPLSAESYGKPTGAEAFAKPLSADFSRASSSTPSASTPKHNAISTALADMQLKSAGTSRASSPGHGHGVFVHSSYNGGPHGGPQTAPAPRWTTFGAAGESMGRMESNVWRHETEAGMRRREDARRRETEGEARQGADLQRRKSEGAKRRKIGSASEASEGAPPVPAIERRASGGETERRMSIVEEHKDRPMSIVEHIRRTTEASAKEPEHRGTASSLPETSTRTNSLPPRRGSAPVPGLWTGDAPRKDSQAAIVVSDSPEAETGDTEMATVERAEPLIPAPQSPSRLSTPTAPQSSSMAKSSSQDRTPIAEVPHASLEPIRRASVSDDRNGSTPPASAPFGHIWPTPSITVPAEHASKKGRRTKYDVDVPSRSFITKLNLPPTPSVQPAAKATSPEDEGKDKEIGSSQPSALRSMLTTMPPRVVFMAAVQTFLSQPATKTRRNRAVIMTKSLMKDALGVLLDPNTDELLKDYVPPEKKKDEEKSSKDRDGTPARGRKMSVAVETADHSSLEFKAWVKRMFSTVKTSRGEDTLAFGGKPVVVEDDIYETIVICHSQGNHCNTEETARLVDQSHSWVPRALIEAFVQECPGCPPSNKVLSASAKPKKRKWVRGADKAPAATTKCKPATTRRGKKAQDAEQASRKPRKAAGKEASPEESDGELDNEQEEDELKESGDEAGGSGNGDNKAESKSEPERDDQDQDPDPDQDQDQDQDPDQDEAEGGEEGDEAEELEMESEDEHVSAAPASRQPVVASSVPDLAEAAKAKGGSA